jgi:hypothetical protein
MMESIIHAFNAVIVPGDIVTVHRENLIIICQVLQFISLSTNQVQLWVEPEAPPPLCPLRYDAIDKSKVKEQAPGSAVTINQDDIGALSH